MARLQSLFLVCTLFLSGCLSVHRHTSAFDAPSLAPKGFHVGAASVEITPPAGYPLAGHSVAAGVSRGYWTRLYARAFFIVDQNGHPLVLVSADLFGIPAGLRARVMELLHDRGLSLPEQAFLIAATHTHHGPGNFLSSPLYNSFASPLPGFRNELLEFLAQRIANAVLQARLDSEKPGIHDELFLHTGLACGILRNRAAGPFSLDPANVRQAVESRGKSCEHQDEDLRNCAIAFACRSLIEVDPTLMVLEDRRTSAGATRPHALLVFLAVHNTAISHDNPVYTADHIGLAMTKVEQRIGPDVTAGFFNGAEGDVSPRWRSQDANDVRRISDRLAEAVLETLQTTGAQADGEILVAGAFSEIARDDKQLAKPVMGVAALGGAEDGRTFLYHYGWHGGVLDENSSDAQSPKIPALDHPTYPSTRRLKPTKLVAKTSDFPKAMPVALVRLGNLLSIGTLPVEMSTAMGWQIREDLAVMEQPRRFVLIGLANEYSGYVTTPDEYKAQAYEGASNAFGPATGPRLEQELVKLSSELSAGATWNIHVQRKSFDMGAKYSEGIWGKLGPERFEREHFLGDEGLEVLLPDELVRLNPYAPRCDWTEPVLGLSVEPTASPLAEQQQTKAIQSCGKAGLAVFQKRCVQLLDGSLERVLDDESSGDFVTLLLGKGDRLTQLSGGEDASAAISRQMPLLWRAIWIHQPAHLPEKVRFRIITADGRTCVSDPFEPASTTSEKPVALHCD